MKIGIAGTGKMGTAIAGRLQSLGHEVFVWNRTAAKADAAIKAGDSLHLTYGGKPLTKSAQVRMCGNSVSPPVAAAIVAANFSFQQMRRAA